MRYYLRDTEVIYIPDNPDPKEVMYICKKCGYYVFKDDVFERPEEVLKAKEGE